MPDPRTAPTGSEPPPNTVTYRNPRRTSPQNSITLRHHRLAREASKRHSPTAIPAAPNSSTQAQTQAGSLDQQQANSPRRNSSGESNQTGTSDPKRWFDQQNENSMRHVDTTAMDIDPPFYQKETDSSNEDVRYPIPTQSPAYRFVQNRAPGLSRPEFTQSSSADDYRSVIDDLTVENKRLKEQLKRYRQMGPDSLRRDKLFEVKVHGLPSRKKRELEAALRDFTTSLEGSSAGASPRKNAKKNIKPSSEGVSKHASSTSGSQSRPIDSAYASMSTGVSSDPSLPTSQLAKHQTDKNVEDYLRDIPEGLWPRPTVMTEKEKKKLVVRRLEHLFTGKMGAQPQPPSRYVPPPIAEDVELESTTNTSEGKSSAAQPLEAAREATIRPAKGRRKESSRDTGSASNEHSNGDATDSRENGSGTGGASGGSNTSPQEESPTKQRPTRPRDLDPDRQQVPAENMDYIRHLGMAAPQGRTHYSSKDVSPDADGWVYLNLLCNLAQLHILNVTPDFIRSAVAEKSTKFQMSPDGKKIRWRGGVEGTRFSSDTSGSNSHRSQSGDDTDGSNDQDQRKKQKTATEANDVIPASGQATNFKPQHQDSNSSLDFHYKPLFVHHNTSSSDEQPSVEVSSSSSTGGVEESNQGYTSRWGQSRGAGIAAGVAGGGAGAGAPSAGVSQRKRRRDGAIIYYSGANFCTDLSGDFGEVSPDTYDMTSSGDNLGPGPTNVTRPQISRSSSGSSLPFRPLSDPRSHADMDLDDSSKPQVMTPAATSDDTDDIDAQFEWSDHKQTATLLNLEASGLAGIYPDDHFVVVVSTKRRSRRRSSVSDTTETDSDSDTPTRPRALDRPSHDTSDSRTTTESIAGKLAFLTTRSPTPFLVSNVTGSIIKIEYMTGKVRNLPPAALPPPAFYFPNQSSDSDLEDSISDSETEESYMSRRVVLADGPVSENGDLSGNDEEDEHSEGEGDYDASGSMSSNRFEDRPTADFGPPHNPDMPRLTKMTSGSSAATAGGAASGAASGYNSSAEE